MNAPLPSIDLIVWAALFKAMNDREPTVSELPPELAICLGKKVFQYVDHMREHHFCNTRIVTERHAYVGCLYDHGISRDAFDGVDKAILKASPDEAPYWVKQEARNRLCHAQGARKEAGDK